MTSLENTGRQGGDSQMDAGSSSLESTDTDYSPATTIDRLLNRYELPKEPEVALAIRHRRIALLTRTVHAQILPKLALTHRYETAEAATPRPVARVDGAELVKFTGLVLAHDLQAAITWMERLVAGGAGLADICLSVLAPAARRLGEMWNDDLCSFVDVTAGLGTLHTIMYRLREICELPLPIRDMSRRILFVSLAGNQHTFGLQMVTEVFRHSGWDVSVEAAVTEADLPQIVRGNWFAIAGLSIARDTQTRNLGQTIRGIRGASCNKTIGIMVGGPVFAGQPDLARRVGADVEASDAKQAVLRAEGLRLLMASLEHDASGNRP